MIGPLGRDHGPLRQGASGALWRISADAAAAVGDRPVAACARRPRFRAGPGPRTLDLAGDWGRVGFQICYEIIFSGEVVDRANRPDFIFNPSNDAWFGRWGPPQHLAQARLRAVEEGLPVIRSTPTGISAVIDADGRVVAVAAVAHGGRDRRGASARRRRADPVRAARQRHPARCSASLLIDRGIALGAPPPLQAHI